MGVSLWVAAFWGLCPWGLTLGCGAGLGFGVILAAGCSGGGDAAPDAWAGAVTPRAVGVLGETSNGREKTAKAGCSLWAGFLAVWGIFAVSDSFGRTKAKSCPGSEGVAKG